MIKPPFGPVNDPHKEDWYDLPWMIDPAIEFLDDTLRTTMDVLEFGAGYSTPWIAYRVKHLTSVESDRRWFKVVENELGKRLLSKKVELIYAKEIDFPHKISTLRIPKEMYDVAIIDGGSRVVLGYYCWQKIKPGGWLMLDDAQRPQYYPFLHFMENDLKWTQYVMEDEWNGKHVRFSAWWRPDTE